MNFLVPNSFGVVSLVILNSNFQSIPHHNRLALRALHIHITSYHMACLIELHSSRV